MKKIVSIFWCLLLLVSIGCKKEDASASNRLVIWASYTNEEMVVFRDIVADYQRTLPAGAPEFVVEQVPFSGLLSKIITAAIARKTPDICRVDVGHVARLAYGGIAEPLDSYKVEEFMKDELLPIALTANKIVVKDKASGEMKPGLYGISDQVTCVALYYNRDMFASAGLTNPPRTLQEMVTMGKILTNTEKGVYGLGLANSLWWHLPFLYLFNADVLSDNYQECTLDNDRARRAFAFLNSLYREHRIEGGAWKAGAINPDQGFINKRYAMIVSGPWNIKNFGSVNYGISLIPGNGNIHSATNIGGTSMIVLKNSSHKEESVKFLTYLTSQKIQLEWARKTGQMSVNRKVNEIMKGESAPEMAMFMKQIEYAHPRPNVPNYDQLETGVNPYFYSILDGTMTVEQGLGKAARFVRDSIIPALQE